MKKCSEMVVDVIVSAIHPLDVHTGSCVNKLHGDFMIFLDGGFVFCISKMGAEHTYTFF